MSSITDSIRARLARGEHVAATELVEAEAADRLAAMQADIDAQQSAAAAEQERAAAVELALAAFEADADRVTDRLELAGIGYDDARAELLAAEQDIAETVRRHRERLHRLGFSVSDPSDFVQVTDGRVIIDRDQLGHTKERLPSPAGYVRWARELQSERDQ